MMLPFVRNARTGSGTRGMPDSGTSITPEDAVGRQTECCQSRTVYIMPSWYLILSPSPLQCGVGCEAV